MGYYQGKYLNNINKGEFQQGGNKSVSKKFITDTRTMLEKKN